MITKSRGLKSFKALGSTKGFRTSKVLFARIQFLAISLVTLNRGTKFQRLVIIVGKQKYSIYLQFSVCA